jgi:hypothetical protein
MITYPSHRVIIELWNDKALKSPDEDPKTSGITRLARDITRYMPGAPICSYHKVLRWWERNSIPVEYHEALVEAARMRNIPGITHQALARIKADEMISRHEARCAHEAASVGYAPAMWREEAL